MKKMLVILVTLIVALNCVFAADLTYLEDFQVKEGDKICVITNVDEAKEIISLRIYLNEDKTDSSNLCNSIYRITKGGRFEDSTFGVEYVKSNGLDLTSIMKDYEFTGDDLIESLEVDLAVFQDIIPGVEIDNSGSYYYGYEIDLNELYGFVEEVVDHVVEQEDIEWF